MLGAYTSSKFAVEALADAWRMELRPWGISVSLIEPGSIDTDLWRTAPQQQELAEAEMSERHRDLYAKHLSGVRRLIPRVQKMAKPAEGVAAAIERALTDPKPKARYLVGTDARAQAALAALVPQRLMDTIVARGAGTPLKL